MPIHRKILPLFYMLVLLLTGATDVKADLRIGIASEPYPPFSWKDSSGNWVGWEIDFMNAVCREMKEDCKIVEVAWDSLIPALRGNFIDVIWASMSATPERQKLIDFTRVYYETPNGIIGHKDGDMDISAAHLEGKTLGVQVSSIHQRYAAKHFSKSFIKTYQTADEVTQDLTAGRVDYILDNLVTLGVFLESAPGRECCESKGELPRDLEVAGLGAGGGVRKGENQLKQRLNAAIKAVHDSGEYDAITRKYFAFDIWVN